MNQEPHPIAHHYHYDVCTYAKVKSLEHFTMVGLEVPPSGWRLEVPLVWPNTPGPKLRSEILLYYGFSAFLFKRYNKARTLNLFFFLFSYGIFKRQFDFFSRKIPPCMVICNLFFPDTRVCEKSMLLKSQLKIKHVYWDEHNKT